VGGAVRDLLLDLEPKDFDVATDATPEEVRDIFRRSRIIGRRFRLVHVMCGAETVEVSTFRGGVSDDVEEHARDEHGRILRDNVFGSQEEDALRRDFTVNALFYDPATQEILDYTNGFADIGKHVIRMIGDPEQRYPSGRAFQLAFQTALAECSPVFEAIVTRAREVGAATILDTYQSAGIIPVDVAGLGVDFAVGGCLKWLCGGPGNAFLYTRPDLLKRAQPSFTGWLSRQHPFDFDIEGSDLRNDAMHMMNGTPSIPAYYAALAGLDIINAVGVDRIRDASRAMTQRLLSLVDEYGFTSAASRNPDRLAGTVAVNVPDALQVARTLKARDFVVDYRPPVGVRISPHFYNTVDEIDRIMAEIKSITATKDYAGGSPSSLVT